MAISRILKAHDARGLGSRVVFNYEDIRKRCDDSIEAAERKAAEILENASREAEAIRSKAHASGLAAGRESGIRDIETEVQRRAIQIAEQISADKLRSTLPAMIEAVSALDRERDRWLAEWEAFGIRLSVAVAEKIVRRQLDLQPETAATMFAETLRLAAGSTSISLRLNPNDVALLGDHPAELARSMSSCADAAIVPDATVSRGGCVVESQHGVIDARIETQLQRIVDELSQTGA